MVTGVKVGCVHAACPKALSSLMSVPKPSLVRWGHGLMPMDIIYSVHLISFILIFFAQIWRENTDHMDFEDSSPLGSSSSL